MNDPTEARRYAMEVAGTAHRHVLTQATSAAGLITGFTAAFLIEDAVSAPLPERVTVFAAFGLLIVSLLAFLAADEQSASVSMCIAGGIEPRFRRIDRFIIRVGRIDRKQRALGQALDVAHRITFVADWTFRPAAGLLVVYAALRLF